MADFDASGNVNVSHHPSHHRYPEPSPHAALVVYLILFTLVGAQLGLVWWKHAHQRSYDLVSLIGLWLIPGFASFHYMLWPFGGVWTIFSIVTLYVFYLCLRSDKLDSNTPRVVFTWFLYSHHVCIAVGGAGYVLFLLELLGASPLVTILFGKGASFNLLFYGLYFGVLGRDTAEVASSSLVRFSLEPVEVIPSASMHYTAWKYPTHGSTIPESIIGSSTSYVSEYNYLALVLRMLLVNGPASDYMCPRTCLKT